MKVYAVGGSVRDSFLGIESNDIDYAIEAPSYTEMKDYIEKTLEYKILYEKPEFHTIKAKHKHKQKHQLVDFVLCRKEGIYNDRRHPSSTEPGTIYDDLSRRDFTMNSIAIDISTNQIIDPYNGIQHIKEKYIKCVGETRERFLEDPLRLLRAVRFHITLGFQLSEEIQTSLRDEELISYLESVSAERIAQEITKCIEKDSKKTLTLFVEYSELFEYVCKKVQFKVTKK